MDVDHEAIVQVFLTEAEDGLSAMEEALVHLEAYPDDGELLGKVFRGAHTLKGDAAALGLHQVAELAHSMENVLERLRARVLPVTKELVTLLLRCIDVLRRMVPAAALGREATTPEAQGLLEQLAGVIEPSAEGPLSRRWALAAEAGPEGPPSWGRWPSTDDRARARTLRVNVDKLDRMLGLMGELSIARSRLSRMLGREGAHTRLELVEAHEETERLFLDLQDVIMKARMVPIEETFRFYTRAARELAASQGKLVRLHIDAQDVEVDTRIVKHMRHPLSHMICNAIDHGIEHPAERAAKGKDPWGRVTLRAYHDAGSIVIEVSDDGVGMNRAKILERARAHGLVSESSHPSDEEVYRLVFAPGLSTTDTVTQLSGRGIGMDVVRRNVEAVRGSLSIRSCEGEGCAITIRLPVTLAIIDGFGVGVADETYVLPLEAIVECLELPEQAQPRPDGTGVVSLRGRPLPYVRLRALFDLKGAPPPRESVVVVEHEDTRIGLVVDALHGDAQTVVKPLSGFLKGLPGVSASTILGDGRVALILDVPGVCRAALGQ